MNTLFELPQQTELINRIPNNLIGKTCNSCKHRERHQMGGSIIQYCGIRKSKRTENVKCRLVVVMSMNKIN